MTSEDQLEKLFSGTTSIIGRLSRLDVFARSIAADAASEVDAVHYLRSQLEPTAYIPPGGGWAAQYKTVAYMVAAILEGRVTQEALELGGGVSTIWMGLALRKRGSGHLTSLDHDAAYAERTQRLVTTHGLDDVVNVMHAPLVEQSFGGRSATWYDVGDLAASMFEVDLLFIDGPPATDDPLAREPAFERLCSTLVDDAIVILDDVERPGEQQMLSTWTREGSHHGRLHLADRVGRSAVLKFSANPPAKSPDQTTS